MVLISNEIVNDINTMLCPIKVTSNPIELTVHTSSYCVLDLLCVKWTMLVVIDEFKSTKLALLLIESESFNEFRSALNHP